MALARLSRKFIEKLRYTAERPKVAESYSPLVAAPSRAHAPRGVEVPVYIFVCARTAHAVKKKARCGHSAVASASRVGQLVASPMAAVMVAIMDVVLVLFDGHLSSVSGSCGQRSVERTVDWTVVCALWCVLYRQKLSQNFCESCGYVVQKNERKVALTCNESLAKAKTELYLKRAPCAVLVPSSKMRPSRRR